jgi:hypothetical protein
MLRLCCVALVGVLAFVPLQLLLEFDEASLAFACVALISTLTLIILVIVWRSVVGVAIIAVYIALAWMLLSNDYPLREKARWAAFASQYKADVLASFPPPPNELRHVSWDAWGWAGMDTYVYLVFDPSDSLRAASSAKSPLKLAGIPCPGNSVQQMEPHWYSVRYFTDEQWGSCGGPSTSSG